MAQGLKLIGTLPPARLESQQLAPPGKWSATMVREFYGSPDTTPPAPPFPSLRYAGYSIERPVEGGFGKIRWRYEGGQGEEGGDAPADELNPMTEVAELQISLDQVPLQAHPHIAEIIKRFKGTLKDGELSFPMNDPTGRSKRKAVNEANEEISLNPFYGVTSYLAPRVVFRLRRMHTGAKVETLGKIESPPWPNVGKPLIKQVEASGGNWLKVAVNTREWGDKFESMEEWLYAESGWSTRIYG